MHNMIHRPLRRSLLLGTVAFAGICAASPAFAGDGGANDGGFVGTTSPDAQSGLVSIAAPAPQVGNIAYVAPEAQVNVGVTGPVDTNHVDAVTPEPQISIADPQTPTTARDPVNITGISQMVIDAGGGSVGLCTATLINPRTVILAAHCVNSRAANAYGSASGGTAIGFGFETNTRANGPGQVDELVQWLFGGHQTNLVQAFYNANYVAYNQFSLEPEARSFLYGDVALATLDTPAANIPTWALLFSPLPDPGAIGAAGTGYNVGIAGYGRNGTGTAGTGGIDFRRRAAENVLGALTDLVTFESFLFGSPSDPTLTQNLYFLDFDDPLRGFGGASPFDFNAFRDNARVRGDGTPTEGITASGDSGGPLILQNFSRQFVIGVLSGGYTRFFNGQPANSYGTVSFYQPLYLYWDWIAANNPYHYVSANAGDGQWTDPTHWVTTLDPSYYILSGGAPVNGIPTNPGEQKNGTSGDFGQACFQTTSSSDCLDLATGAVTSNGNPIGTAASQPAEVAIASNSSGFVSATGAVRESQAGGQVQMALPVATLANGLPGASGFVPNNADPDRLASIQGRYFDVTLAATGTTTLSGANITIDRLTIGTGGARLVIDTGASLSTLINTTQLAGFVTVNGTLNSVGDYSLMGGGLMGSGRINAPFLTSITGQIAPGTTTTIGTLTVGGNVVLSSASGLFINIGPNGTSDRLVIVANGTSTGAASLGGGLTFQPVAGYRPTFNDSFTILTAAGGRTGTFTTTAFSAILSPQLTYSANAVTVRIAAATYASVINTGSPIQQAYAQLLDQNRSNYAELADVYGDLDMLSATAIRANLEALAPQNIPLVGDLGRASSDVLSSFIRQRIANANGARSGGRIASYGQPLQLASLAISTPMLAATATDAGNGMRMSEGAIAEDMSIYLAGGYVDGRGTGLPTATPTGRSNFDGFYLSAGMEKSLGEDSFLGLSMGYVDLDGRSVASLATAGGRLVQGTLYGATGLGGGMTLDGQISAGQYRSTTTRIVPVGPSTFTLRAQDSVLNFTSELGLSFEAGNDHVAVTPRASIRYNSLGFTPTAESGNGPALQYDLGSVDSLQARAGFSAGLKSGGVRPFVTANLVHEFSDRAGSVGANFRGGIGPLASFALAGTDENWAEVSGGLMIGTGNLQASIAGETTISRSDLRATSVRGTISWRF